MYRTSTLWLRQKYLCVAAVGLSLLGSGLLLSPARGESLDVPPPRSATNAALHYQRAILFLTAIDPDKRDVLDRPIWEIITAETSDSDLAAIDDLLGESRHAIRSTLEGARQMEADFGLDVRQYMVASYLPHCHPMTLLGRLLALHGMQRQSTGDWDSAAKIYLAGFRVGRHMCRQVTLAEALAGVEVLETSYFALGHWAARCPDQALVSEALNIVNAMSTDMVNPARTLRFEATISRLRFNALQDAYPDGAWPEMVLEALGKPVPATDHEGMRQAAIDAAAERGVPREAFDSKESLDKYLTGLKTTYVQLAKEGANCMTFPPPESIERGETVFAKFEPKLPETERASTLNPAKIAAYFAVHQAELDVLRLVLAVCAERTSAGFPPNLDGVRNRLGRELPKSPYDGSQYEYEVLEDGKGFSIKLAAAKIGGIDLPEIRFQHVGPADAK